MVGGEVLKINENKMALEEFVFNVKNEKSEIKDLANSLKKFLPKNELINNLEDRLVIVSDNVFKDFVSYAVEVRTRIKIDQTTGTVEERALFTEELIPSESVFYSLVFIADPYLGIPIEKYLKLKEFKKAKNNQQKGSKEWNEVSETLSKNEKVKRAFEGNYFTASEIRKELQELLNNELIQLRGDETIGMGFMRVKFYYNDKKNQEA